VPLVRLGSDRTAEPSGGLAASDQPLPKTSGAEVLLDSQGATASWLRSPFTGEAAAWDEQHTVPTPRSRWPWWWTPRRPGDVRWRCRCSTVSCAAALRRGPQGVRQSLCGWRRGKHADTREWLDRLAEHRHSLGVGEAGARSAAVTGPPLGMLLEPNALVAVGLRRWPLTTLGYVVAAYGVDFRISAHFDHRIATPRWGFGAQGLLQMLADSTRYGLESSPSVSRDRVRHRSFRYRAIGSNHDSALIHRPGVVVRAWRRRRMPS
jgi:hypothetical protein